jgi:uncharacterized protein YjbJ (UPF0337 family)
MQTKVLADFRYKESAMNKDQVKGRANEVKGKVKQAVGSLSGDKELAKTGKDQNARGKVQSGYGDLKEDVKKIGKNV